MEVIKKEDFLLQVTPFVKETHYINQNVKAIDTLSVGSMEYDHIKSKPARYASLIDNQFDVIFSHKRNLSIDRAVLLRTLDEIAEYGWYYEEMALLCESLGFEMSIVSITETGYGDYFERILSGEILNSKGDPLTEPIAFPKVFFDSKLIRKTKKLYRTFHKWQICPDCGSSVEARKSDQESYKNKYIYLCSNEECGFQTALPDK